jgi:membrane protease YdiL (CAAX protease family)
MRARADALRELLAVFAAVTVVTVVVSWIGRVSPLGDYVHVVVGALFLWSALRMAQRQPDGLARCGLQLGGLLEPSDPPPSGLLASVKDLLLALGRATPSALRELGVALAVAAVVFPPFVLGFRFWHAPERAFALRVPDELASYALTQLLVVAVPEEAFFRGYLQTRATDAFPQLRRVLGAMLSPRAWLLQAALFALIHFAVDLNPARLAVFFPALLFGWLRALRGGIGAPAALHALCNLFSDVLVRSWL